MKGAIRSEALRSVSGLSVLPVSLVALLIPVFVLFSDGSRFDLAGLDPGTATTRLLEPLAWSGIAAAFVSAYAVTREYYYGSMERTLAAVGFRRAFVGKLIAAALVSVTMSVGVFAIWTVGITVILSQDGQALTVTVAGWRIYAGALVAVILGAAIGQAVGWITRNYYATAGIILVLPMAIEFALLRTAPEVAKFSPGLALAAVSVSGFQGRLLDLAPALGIGVAWAAGLVFVAWVLGRRRFE